MITSSGGRHATSFSNLILHIKKADTEFVVPWAPCSIAPCRSVSKSDAQVVRTPIRFFPHVFLQDAFVLRLLLAHKILIGRNCGLGWGWGFKHLLQVFRGLAAGEYKRRLSFQHGGDMPPRRCILLDQPHVIVAEDDIALGLDSSCACEVNFSAGDFFTQH